MSTRKSRRRAEDREAARKLRETSEALRRETKDAKEAARIAAEKYTR